METNIDTKLIDAIKSDDLVLFSEYIKGKENYSFGRFPLLSLAYMYKAKKIIRKFEARLGVLKKYTVVYEPIELFKNLVDVAGKSARIYLNAEIIFPIEMLALMGDVRALKRNYNSFYKDGKIKDNISRVFKISAQDIKFLDGKIEVTKRKLGYQQRKSIIFMASMSGAMAIVLALIYIIIGMCAGFGYGSSYFKISSEAGLFRALKASSNYVLTKDLALDKFSQEGSFSGTLDGNGHTLYVSNINEYLVQENSGTLKNLNIVYSIQSVTSKKEISLFVQKNIGKIDNVNIKIECENILFEKNENDSGIYGFCIENSGEILGSNISMKLTISTLSDGECGVTGFVKNNSGIINGCEVTSDSKIEATNCDISSIALNNDFAGEILNCTNRAELKQTSDQNGWSPNVSGICQTNLGTIVTSTNYGTICNISNNTHESASGQILVGGVVATNYGVIDNCYNAGDINITSSRINIFAGGIVASSDYTLKKESEYVQSRIFNCGVRGNISASVLDEGAMVFLGGISGYAYGEIRDSFSSATFTNGANEKNYFVGTLAGAVECVTSYNFIEGKEYPSSIYLGVYNCYLLDMENVEYHMGCLVTGNSIKFIQYNYSVSNISNGATTVYSLDKLKSQEVYYDR